MSLQDPLVRIVPLVTEVDEGETTAFEVYVLNYTDVDLYSAEIILSFAGSSATRRIDNIERGKKLSMKIEVAAPLYTGLQPVSVSVNFVDQKSPSRRSMMDSTRLLVNKNDDHIQAETTIAKVDKLLTEIDLMMIESMQEGKDTSRAKTLYESSRSARDKAISYLSLNSYKLARENANWALEVTEKSKKSLVPS